MRDHLLGQTFDNGHLPRAALWLADQGDGVLSDPCAGHRETGEDLDDALEVFVTANNRRQLPLACLSGKIDAHLVKGWRRGSCRTGRLGKHSEASFVVHWWACSGSP